MDLQIRAATSADADAMWSIFQAVIDAGDALPFATGFTRQTFDAHWFGSHRAYVATSDGNVLGMYKLGANYPDRGSHVASATYLVSPASQGRGIGRAFVENSIDQARREGFLAMQFNFVVSTNLPAVELYKKFGFAVAGILPKAFRHQQLGLVDAYVMHRFLQAPIEFRPAQLDDIEQLNAIAFRSKAYWGYSDEQMEVWRADLAISPEWVVRKLVHIALLDSEVVGFFVVADNADAWRLEHLWVIPGAMRRGAGRALLAHACTVAQAHGASSLIIDADPNAADFYQACGAEHIGEKAAPIPGVQSRTLPVFRLLIK